MRRKSTFMNRLAFFNMVLAIALTASATSAQTSSFTYQGRLTDGGSAATGNYDLQFALWDSASGGTQIGVTQSINTVAISNGAFTVSLDFGAGSFNGANRFLEIGARPISGGAFTILSPRQQVTATPYAIRSVSASSADTATTATTATNATQLGGVAASQFVQTNDSRLSDSRPPTAGSVNYIQNSTTAQSNTNFNISGNATVGGTLSGGIVNAASQFDIGGNRVLSVSGVGTFPNSNTIGGVGAGASLLPDANGNGSFNSFLGLNAGNANTTGSSNSFFGTFAGPGNTTGRDNSFFGGGAGFANTQGLHNSFFGSGAGSSNTAGVANSCFGAYTGCNTNTTGSFNTLIGAGADTGSANLINATAIGAFATVTQSNSLVLGTTGFGTTNSAGTFNAGATSVGIGTTAPLFRLHVIDPGAAGLRVQTNTSGGAVASFGGFGDFQIDSNGVAGGRFVVQQGGRVGINTASPDQLLSVNGNASKVGGGSWATFSDERLKNIKGNFTSGLKAVMQLRPIRYEYKQDNALNLKSDGEYVGFSAQAVQKIIPAAVLKNDKGYLLINNDPILWTMLNAIKEQQAEIQSQERRIEKLDAEVRCLRARRVSVKR